MLPPPAIEAEVHEVRINQSSCRGTRMNFRLRTTVQRHPHTKLRALLTNQQQADGRNAQAQSWRWHCIKLLSPYSEIRENKTNYITVTGAKPSTSTPSEDVCSAGLLSHASSFFTASSFFVFRVISDLWRSPRRCVSARSPLASVYQCHKVSPHKAIPQHSDRAEYTDNDSHVTLRSPLTLLRSYQLPARDNSRLSNALTGPVGAISIFRAAMCSLMHQAVIDRTSLLWQSSLQSCRLESWTLPSISRWEGFEHSPCGERRKGAKLMDQPATNGLETETHGDHC